MQQFFEIFSIINFLKAVDDDEEVDDEEQEESENDSSDESADEEIPEGKAHKKGRILTAFVDSDDEKEKEEVDSQIIVNEAANDKPMDSAELFNTQGCKYTVTIDFVNTQNS